MTVTSNLIKDSKKPLLPLFSAWLFTLVGGYASAYAYIMLDGVFANMQTGNIIKCVVYAIEGREFGYLVYSVLAFVAGVIAAVMPVKNNPNPAKTPQFTRFLSNSRLKYV